MKKYHLLVIFLKVFLKDYIDFFFDFGVLLLLIATFYTYFGNIARFVSALRRDFQDDTSQPRFHTEPRFKMVKDRLCVGSLFLERFDR